MKKKGLGFFTAYILPFIIIFWGNFGKLIQTGTKVNMMLIIIGFIIFFLWRGKTSKSIMRYNEGDIRINWYNIVSYAFMFVLGSGFVYYISKIAMEWHYILLIIGVCQITAEFIEISHYQTKDKIE